tara:strand:- start:320 stop:562 length:243 start_codon:yes stop_codon:yes gene_type:complete
MKLFNNKTFWNFPIAKAQIEKVKEVYKNKGLPMAILYVILILVGFKVFVINGIIFILNYLFKLNIEYGPFLYYVLGVELI